MTTWPALRQRYRARHDAERGDAGPLETVLLIPPLLLLFGLIVAFGRTTTATNDVAFAARVGARSAAGAQTLDGARRRATDVVATTLSSSGLACVKAITAVTGDVRPGGRMTVTVSCTVQLSDITHFGLLPGSRTLHSTATEVIDLNRGGNQ
jgi:Flp pilus assembly protein TadG